MPSCDDLKQVLYLIADEMRGMATVGGHFAANIYERERAQRIMDLAARIAALADDDYTPDEIKALFDEEPWHRYSPAIGVDAAVLNPQGELLLIQRRDNQHWALPGGLSEVGRTFAETAVHELWEEAGLRGRTVRLLGVFDGARWGSRLKAQIANVVFLMEAETLQPRPGMEAIDARFFAPDHLPQPLHPGHAQRIPRCLEMARTGQTHVDHASAAEVALSPLQRPAAPDENPADPLDDHS